MTLPLVFRAMAHERNAATSRELLDEPEREFLAVILDRTAPRINWTVHEKFAPVLSYKLGPCDTGGLNASQNSFARRK